MGLFLSSLGTRGNAGAGALFSFLLREAENLVSKK